jgi:hypothetical protein
LREPLPLAPPLLPLSFPPPPRDLQHSAQQLRGHQARLRRPLGAGLRRPQRMRRHPVRLPQSPGSAPERPQTRPPPGSAPAQAARCSTPRSRRPDILRQSHHGNRCQLMYLNVEPAQDFANKSVRRQAKSGGKERLKNNQLALRLGDFLRPRDSSNSAAKVTLPLHILHADRRHPRHAKINRIAGAQILRHQTTLRLLRRGGGRRRGINRQRSGSGRRRGRHRYVPSTAAGGLLQSSQISGEQEHGGQTSSKAAKRAARVFTERGK